MCVVVPKVEVKNSKLIFSRGWLTAGNENFGVSLWKYKKPLIFLGRS